MNHISFQLIFISIVLFIVVIGLFFNRKAVVKRKLKKAPLKRIIDFRSGDIAKIVGKVELVDEPLIAPLSRRKCAAYSIHIEEKVSSGKNSHWRTIVKEEDVVRFLINDGTACARVDNKHLKSYIVQDWKASSGFRNDATADLERYLNQHGGKSENFMGFNKTIRYREGVLEVDEKIAVWGKGEWRNSYDLNFPEKYGRILEISAPEGQHVYLSDDQVTVKKKESPRYSREYRR